MAGDSKAKTGDPKAKTGDSKAKTGDPKAKNGEFVILRCQLLSILLLMQLLITWNFSGSVAQKKKKEVKKETGLGLTYKKDENFGEWYSEVFDLRFYFWLIYLAMIIWVEMLCMIDNAGCREC